MATSLNLSKIVELINKKNKTYKEKQMLKYLLNELEEKV